MPAFAPVELPSSTLPFFQDLAGERWEPVTSHRCRFAPDIFHRVMSNLIKNPNINSRWLFRADVLYDDHETPGNKDGEQQLDRERKRPRPRDITGFSRDRTLVRRLVPRNEKRDKPLDQTCTFHSKTEEDGTIKSLVIYIPHFDDPEAEGVVPFYHPDVAGIAHLHTFPPSPSHSTASNPEEEEEEGGCSSEPAEISIHCLPLPHLPPIASQPKLLRTAHHLLRVLHKHGTGQAEGYSKRVHHDLLIPQSRCQDRYAALKARHAKALTEGWVEVTDSGKHVFEDLGIAAFLIELWRDMYRPPGGQNADNSGGENGSSSSSKGLFPGFVDIGCGNGLLVWILNQEGYSGWGFDARARKSWAQYSTPCSCSPSGQSLEQRLLLPSVVTAAPSSTTSAIPAADTPDLSSSVHNGLFPEGTFLISNHADELTPWTPLLATLSSSPFVSIPCCSHDLGGNKHRPAPPTADRQERYAGMGMGEGKSTYASLVDWTARLAEECGWEVEVEMLRIPSTRNACLVGRRRTPPEVGGEGDDVAADGEGRDQQGPSGGHETRQMREDLVRSVIARHGGAGGFYESVVKLLKTALRGH